MNVRLRHNLHATANIVPFAVFSLASTVSAQSKVIDIPSEPTCSKCRILMQPVVEIGKGGDELGSFSYWPSNISRDSRGRYYFALPFAEETAPAVYDANGKYLTTIGGVGEGPGEFRMPMHILIAPGDTIHVFDRTLARHTVVSPSYEYVRSNRIPRRHRTAAILKNGIIALNASVPDAGRIGKYIHLFDPEGAYLGAFTDSIEIHNPATSSTNWQWVLSRSSQGNRFWATRLAFRYQIRLWDDHGRLLKTLQPAAAWYKPYERVIAPAPDRLPISTIYGSWEDESGYLWVIGDVASPNWRRFLARKPKRVEGALVYETIDRQGMYDTVIEVFNPRTNRLVVSQRFPSRTFEYPIGDNLIGGIRETDEGIPYVAVWRVRLVRP